MRERNRSRSDGEILTERHRCASIIVTSNREPDERLATFADPMRAQAAIDRFTSNTYDLVIEGESYRQRLKPKLSKRAPVFLPEQSEGTERRAWPRSKT